MMPRRSSGRCRQMMRAPLRARATRTAEQSNRERTRMSAPIESLEPRRLLSSAGELDPTFGNHFGLELPAREDRVPARVAVQSDGRIVVAGEARQIDSRNS